MGEQTIAELNAEAERSAKQAVRDFARGAVDGNLHLMASCFPSLDFGDVHGGGWARAMREIFRLPSVPGTTREWFLDIYLRYSEHIRHEGEDRALLSGLRMLLPRYDGPPLTLYRGDGFHNRCRRTYGPSWTSSIEVARGFAEDGVWRCTTGGSVLLEAYAPLEAIICAPALIDDRYGESEYIVDRRKLPSGRVVERFASLSIDEFLARNKSMEPEFE